MPWIRGARSGSLCLLLLRVCLHSSAFFPLLLPSSYFFPSAVAPRWLFFVLCVSSLHLPLLPFSPSSVSVSFLHSSVIPRGPERGGRDVEMCVWERESSSGTLKQNPPFLLRFYPFFLSQLLSSEVSLSVNFNAKLTCLSSPLLLLLFFSFISCFIFPHGLHPGQLYKFQKRELKDWERTPWTVSLMMWTETERYTLTGTE